MPNEASDWHGMEQTEREDGEKGDGYANGAVMKLSSRRAAHTIKGAKEGSFLLLPFTVDL